MISLAHAINHVYQLILPVVSAKVAEEYTLSNFSVGFLISIYSLSYTFFQTPFGALSRQLGRKRLLCAGFLINSLAFAAVGFSRDVTTLSILLFLAGVGGSMYHPIGIPLISHNYPENKGEALGYHQTGGSAGSFIAPLIVGFITENFGWRFAFVSLSTLGFAISLTIFLLLQETESENVGSSKFQLHSLIKPMVLMSAATIYMVTLRGVQAFAVKYFHDAKNASYYEATLLYSALQVAGIVSGPLSGRLSDAFGREKIIASLIIIQSFAVFGIITVSGLATYIPCIFFGFATFGLFAATDAFLTQITAPEIIGTVIGINMTLSFAVSVIVPPLLGSLIDYRGFNQSFALMATFSLLSIIPLKLVDKIGKR